MNKLVLSFDDNGRINGIAGINKAKDFQRRKVIDNRIMIRDVEELVK